MVQVRQLFAAMATGGFFGVETIKHVDGGLFNDDSVLLLDADSLRILAEVCGLNWSAIEPVILGTFSSAVCDPDKRSQLGAHFTAKDDILLVVEPVLMAPLRREWIETQAQVRLLADQLARSMRPPMPSAPPRRARDSGAGAPFSVGKALALLTAFRQKLAGLRILDPRAAAAISCTWRSGCCSTWRKRSSIWQRPSASRSACRSFRRRSSTASRSIPTPTSWRRRRSGSVTSSGCDDNGFGLPAEPILKPLTTFRQMDAIWRELGIRSQGQGQGQDQGAGVAGGGVIIGNPPFLGGDGSHELGDCIIDALFALYEDRVPMSDLMLLLV